jgi:lysophospholipase L1-like esterase
MTKQPQVGGEPDMLETRELRTHAEATYSLLKARVSSMAATMPLECSVADVSELLDGVNEQLFWDSVHLTNDGNRRMARAVFDRLLDAGHHP